MALLRPLTEEDLLYCALISRKPECCGVELQKVKLILFYMIFSHYIHIVFCFCLFFVTNFLLKNLNGIWKTALCKSLARRIHKCMNAVGQGP